MELIVHSMALIFYHFHKPPTVGGHILLAHFTLNASPLLLAEGLQFCHILRPPCMNPTFQ